MEVLKAHFGVRALTRVFEYTSMVLLSRGADPDLAAILAQMLQARVVIIRPWM